MRDQPPEKPHVLLVASGPESARWLEQALGDRARVDVARSVSECHVKTSEWPSFDAVIVDQGIDSLESTLVPEASDGSADGRISASEALLHWLEVTRPRTPALVVKPPHDPEPSTLGKAISHRLGYYVLLAVPDSEEWNEAAKVVEAASGSYFHLEFLPRPDEVLAPFRRAAAKGRDADLEAAADRHLQSPDVLAMVVVTGEGEHEAILMMGRDRKGGPLRLPAGKALENAAGYKKAAILLYLAVRAALVTGAGLPLHRSVAGCPADFCFDLLDLARGLTTGEICEHCQEWLEKRLREGTCGLTPIQIADLEKVLRQVAALCDAGKEGKGPGGVPLPEDTVLEGFQAKPPPHPAVSSELRANLTRMSDVVKEHFSEYSEAERILCPQSSFLLAARHYNSDSPTIPGPRGFARRSNIDAPIRYVGGGYFLAHRGVGIAIDPGYDFLRVLYGLAPYSSAGSEPAHQRGYTTEDIDLVIVTHNHLDHHADLETILRSRRGRPLWLCCNREILEEYHLDKRQANTQLEVIDSPKEPGPIELPAEIKAVLTARTLPALHWQHTYSLALESGRDAAGDRLKRHLNGFGLHIELRGLEKKDDRSGSGPPENGPLAKILITGDTLCPVVLDTPRGPRISGSSYEPYLAPKHWSRLLMRREDWDQTGVIDTLKNTYSDFISTYREIEADLACVHVGSLERDVWSSAGPLEKAAELVYGGHHLGLMGSYRILKMLRKGLRLVLLSEFGEELVGFRTHLCGALSDLLQPPRDGKDHSSPHVLPTDVDLCVDLRNGHVRCTRCPKTHHFSEVQAMERGSDFLHYVPREVAENDQSTCHWRIGLPM